MRPQHPQPSPDLRRLGPVLWPHYGRVLAAGLASLGTQLAGIALLAVAAWLIARAAEQPGLDVLMLAVVAVRGLALARGGFRYVERVTGHDAALRAQAELRRVVYARLVAHGRAGAGASAATSAMPREQTDVHTRLVNDVDAVHESLLRVVLPAVATLLAAGATVVFLWLLHSGAAMVLAGALVVCGVALPVLAGWLARRHGAAATRVRTDLAASDLDLLRGTDDLAASDAHGDYVTAAEQHARHLAHLDTHAAWQAAVLTTLAQVTTGLAVCGVLSVALATAGTAVGSAGGGAATPVLIAVLALTTLAALETSAPLVEAGRVWAEAVPSLRRVAGLLSPVATQPAATPSEPPEPATGLEVRLPGIEPRLAVGTSVAIVGPSGAGKSTLLRTLCEERRTHARGITDDAYIFATTLQANLLLARPEASEAELCAAAGRARLLEWIETLPQGWDTEVGAHGAELSGGQRRRLLLARALLAAPEILVLDEPTRGLPAGLADDIIADLLGGGQTVLMVTHRLAGLDAADEVLVVDQGRVVQRGTARELRRAPGAFAELAAREQLATGRLDRPGPASPR